MKSLLKLIAEYQSRSLAKFASETDPSVTSGYADPLDKEIPLGYQLDILINLGGFNKESEAFKSDSDKIVLEKNSTLRALKDGKFFFFRHIDGDELTDIEADEKFADWVYYEKSTHAILLFFSVCISMLLVYLFGNNVLQSILIFSVLPILLTVWTVRKMASFNKWHMAVATDPNQFLGGLVSTSVPDVKDKRVTSRVNLDIDREGSSLEWYKTAREEMEALAFQTEGRVGWVWDYSNAKDKYLFKVDERGIITNTANISITSSTDNILFFVETDYSFIFYFPMGYTGKGGFERDYTSEEKHRVIERFEKEKEKMFVTFS